MDAGAIAGIVIAVVVVLVVGVFKFLIGWKEVRDEKHDLATHYALSVEPGCLQPSCMSSLLPLPGLKEGNRVMFWKGPDGWPVSGTHVFGTVISKCKNAPGHYTIRTDNKQEVKQNRRFITRMVPKK